MAPCKYPGCSNESICGINGTDVCFEHIDWGMGKEVVPAAKLQEIFEADEDDEDRA